MTQRPQPPPVFVPGASDPRASSGTLIMPAFAPLEGPPSGRIRAELDEMSLVLDVQALEAARIPAEALQLEEEPATERRAEPPALAPQPAARPACRRLTFAALRALPARASTLPPAPPRRTQAPAAPTSTEHRGDRIVGVPIVAVGDAAPELAGRPVADSIAPQVISHDVASWVPVGSAPTAAFPAGGLGSDVRADALLHAWGSAAAPPSKPRSGGRLRMVVASTVWAALFGGIGLVATGVIPIDRRGAQAEVGSEAAPAAAPVAAARPAAPLAALEPAPSQIDPAADEPAAAVEDLPDDPAGGAIAAVAKAPAPRANPRGAAARPTKDPKIEIDSLFYGHTADDRSVTLQLDGKSVILREGDVAEDVVVEKILRDGVVFRRGQRRFAVYEKH